MIHCTLSQQAFQETVIQLEKIFSFHQWFFVFFVQYFEEFFYFLCSHLHMMEVYPDLSRTSPLYCRINPSWHALVPFSSLQKGLPKDRITLGTGKPV